MAVAKTSRVNTRRRARARDDSDFPWPEGWRSQTATTLYSSALEASDAEEAAGQLRQWDRGGCYVARCRGGHERDDGFPPGRHLRRAVEFKTNCSFNSIVLSRP